MKNILYFGPAALAAAVLLVLSACDEPNTAPNPNPPVWDDPVKDNPADECPRKDGLACF